MKIKLLVIFVLFSIMISPCLSALEYNNLPICKIKGKIKNIEDREPYTLSPEEEFIGGFALKIKIEEVSYVGGNFIKSCKELYPVGSELIILLSKDKIADEKDLTVNKTIEGDVQFYSSKSFLNYEITKAGQIGGFWSTIMDFIRKIISYIG